MGRARIKGPLKSLKEKGEVFIPDEEVNDLFKGLIELNLIELPDF